ncbi:MAG: restriction endonuclease subunit S [Brevundimonas sp.]|uniref:restriction endonuclease subunit S n=1 Tax=Brevundimonas sp. TaxID=1871086 RepID=UPI00391BC7BC
MTREVSAGLPRVRFGQIAEFRNGLNFDAAATGQSVKVAGVGSFLQRSRLDDFADAAMVTVRGEVSQESLLRDGDLLFVRSNGSKDLVGRCAMVFPGNERVAFSGFTIRARITSDDVHGDYLLAVARSELFRRELHEKGAGSSITNLSQELLSEVELPLPDLDVQRRIASALQTWDGAIDYTERLIAAKRQRFRSLLLGYSAEHQARRVEFGDLVALVSSKAQPGRAGVPDTSVELEDIESETGRVLGCQPVTGDSGVRNRFSAGDTLFGKLRPYLAKFAHPDFDGLCSTEIWVLRARAGILAPELLPFLVQTPEFMAAATKQSGSRMPRADWEVVSSAPVPCPSTLVAQSAVSQRLQAAWSAAFPDLQKLDRLRLQKRGLMQRLLGGEQKRAADPARAIV